MDRRDRQLRRDTRDAFVGGVCNGLGTYFDVDTALVRAFFVASAAFGGFGPALYLVLWILLDDEATVAPLRKPQSVNFTDETSAGPVTAEPVDVVPADWVPLP